MSINGGAPRPRDGDTAATTNRSDENPTAIIAVTELLAVFTADTELPDIFETQA